MANIKKKNNKKTCVSISGIEHDSKYYLLHGGSGREVLQYIPGITLKTMNAAG